MMALRPLRSTNHQSMEYVIPFYQERGGMLSLVSLSGLDYAAYATTVNANTVPLGIMQFDTTEVDLYRAVPPWRTHSAYPIMVPQPYITEGEVITNAIDSTVTNINVYDPCYLAPSGLLTNSTVYGTKQVGRFLSTLNDSRLGAALPLPTQIRIAGNDAIVNPDQVHARSAGWAKVAISLGRLR